jgi:hypothetical protein
METLESEEEIEICRRCKALKTDEGYEWICQECGLDESTFIRAVKQTISRILLKP